MNTTLAFIWLAFLVAWIINLVHLIQNVISETWVIVAVKALGFLFGPASIVTVWF